MVFAFVVEQLWAATQDVHTTFEGGWVLNSAIGHVLDAGQAVAEMLANNVQVLPPPHPLLPMLAIEDDKRHAEFRPMIIRRLDRFGTTNYNTMPYDHVKKVHVSCAYVATVRRAYHTSSFCTQIKSATYKLTLPEAMSFGHTLCRRCDKRDQELWEERCMGPWAGAPDHTSNKRPRCADDDDDDTQSD